LRNPSCNPWLMVANWKFRTIKQWRSELCLQAFRHRQQHNQVKEASPRLRDRWNFVTWPCHDMLVCTSE
jgi:hypothetical protein